MNNEETKVLNQSKTTKPATPKNDAVTTDKKMGTGEKVAYAAGGFAAGAASAMAGAAFASSLDNDADGEVIAATAEGGESEGTLASASTTGAIGANAVNDPETPAPQDAIIATNEGIKVAQVDDDASFGEAFADARAQVGPGGVFEWRGHVYNTYYENEWESMSPAERAEYQAKIDYEAVTDGVETTTGGGVTAIDGHVEAESATTAEIESNAELVDDSSASGDIKVLGVVEGTDADGNQITVAGLEIAGQETIMVDVDNDGMMDVIAIDIDESGSIEAGEVFDASDMNVSVQDLVEMTPDPDALLVQNTDMPDYMNDADVNMLV